MLEKPLFLFVTKTEVEPSIGRVTNSQSIKLTPENQLPKAADKYLESLEPIGRDQALHSDWGLEFTHDQLSGRTTTLKIGDILTSYSFRIFGHEDLPYYAKFLSAVERAALMDQIIEAGYKFVKGQ